MTDNISQAQQIEQKFLDSAKEQLLGKKIILVRYMTVEEADDLGWYQRPIVFVLDDGNIIYPSTDDEGNDGGSLFTQHATDGVLPVMRG